MQRLVLCLVVLLVYDTFCRKSIAATVIKYVDMHVIMSDIAWNADNMLNMFNNPFWPQTGNQRLNFDLSYLVDHLL